MGELTASILYHAGLGIALALAVWAVGGGALLLAGRRRADGLPVSALHAYPVGLLLATAAAVLLLLTPWLAALSAALVLVPAAALIRSALRPGDAVRPLIWALPAVVALPAALGYLLHGPTARLDSSAYGDMLFYVNKLVSAGQSVVPFHDLLAEGQRIIYAEAAPSFLGAAVFFLPGVDAVLVQTTLLPAFLLASVCLGIGLVASGSRPRRELVPAVAVLTVAMVAYPTWVTESPPVTLAVPLAFSMYALWAQPPPTPWLAGLAAVVALDLFLTKVVAAMPFAIVLAFALYARYRGRLTRKTALYAAGALLLGAGVVIVLLVATAGWYADLSKGKFLPGDAVRGLRRQLTERDTQAAAPAFIVAGQLLLGTALLRARNYAFLAALAASLVGNWFVGGYGFDIAVGTVVLLSALFFWSTPAALERNRLLVWAAAVVLALSAWFRDVSPVRASFVLVTLLAVALLAAWGAAAGEVSAPRAAYTFGAGAAAVTLGLAGHAFIGFLAFAALVLVPFLAPRAAAVALPLAVALAVTLAFAAARRDDLRLNPFGATLTTADYDVWQRVADVVPKDALVFTSLTGKEVDGRHGWNNYPAISGRQLYLAGWYDGRLVSRPGELDRRLAVNRRVLAGELSPAGLELDRRFRSFFAVLWRAESPPGSFRRLYANELFALYRIES
jgi:hypothetical protein